MKIWLKMLTGILLGIMLGILLPSRDASVNAALGWLDTFTIDLLRFICVPLMFFSLVISVFQLKEDKNLGKMLVKSAGIGFFVSAVFVVFGILSVLIVQPDRIQQQPSEVAETVATLDIQGALAAVFPPNALQILVSRETYLLPLLVLSLMVGLAFSSDKVFLKPLIQMSDALSRLFYLINNVFVEFTAVAAIVFAAFFTLKVRTVPDLSGYSGLLFLVFADVLILVFLVLPAFVWFLTKNKNPWKFLFALLAPSLLAFVSGDFNAAFGTLAKHAKESLGIRRRANSSSIAVLSVFGRSGSAFIAAVSFLMILKSHSSMGVAPLEIIWLVFMSLCLSFFAGAVPGMGAFAVVLVLSVAYGRGFETGWVILKPLAFIVSSAGAFLDVLVAGIVSLIMAETEGMRENRDVRHFI